MIDAWCELEMQFYNVTQIDEKIITIIHYMKYEMYAPTSCEYNIKEKSIEFEWKFDNKSINIEFIVDGISRIYNDDDYFYETENWKELLDQKEHVPEIYRFV